MYVWSAPSRAIEIPHRTREGFLVAAGAAMIAAIALSTATASLNVDLASPPSALRAGSAWNASVEVKRGGLPVDDARPLVTITDRSGTKHIYPASPGARAGSYQVKIILPEGGRWSYEVHVGSRVYERGTVAAKPSLAERL